MIPVYQGRNQQTQLTGVRLPRGLPPSAPGAIKGFWFGFKAFAPTLRLFLLLGPDSAEPFGGGSVGGRRAEQITVSQWVILLFCFPALFPREPGGGGRESGLLRSGEERGKRKPGGPAEGGAGTGGGSRKQSKCANSLVRAKGDPFAWDLKT